MDTDAQILEIIRVLSTTRDQKLIAQVASLVREAADHEVVGYGPDGNPLSRKSLVESIQEAENDIAEGNTFGSAEILAHFKIQSPNG